MMSKLQREGRRRTPVGAVAGGGVIKSAACATTASPSARCETHSPGESRAPGHIVLSRKASDLEQIRRRERTQLAYDLHDGPARRLVEALHHLEVCEREIREHAQQSDRETMATELNAAVAAVRRSLDDMRTIIHQYRSDPEEQSLQASLVSLIKEFRKFSSTEVFVDLPSLAIQIESGQRKVLGAVVEEALFNAWRHASPTSIAVHVEATASHVTVVVEDDGHGFDVKALKSAGERGVRMGLLGLRERVESCGGQFEVRSRPGRGTAVAARLPLGVSTNARRISA